MNHHSRFFTGCLLLTFFILQLSCSSPPPAKAKEKWAVTFITNSSSDYWKIVQKGAEKADAELANVEVFFKKPYSGEAKEQEKLINDALRRGEADAIAISPIDPVGEKKFINETAKKVPLITQDSDAPDTDRLLYLGADNKAAGRQAGELMKKALPQGGKIMVFVGKKDVQNARERFEGLKEALQGSKIEIIDLMTDDNDHIKAKDNAVEAMDKHPDLAGMIGLWSYNGPAILTAVRNAKKVGKIKIVCFDEEQETLDGIREGAIFATVAQQPFEYGYQAVQILAKLAKGDKSVIPASKMVFIPPVIVQKENVADFSSKLNQLLGTAPAAASASPAATKK
ncbi:MAG: sugar-binding protein [Blastocatellia bacterium]